MKSKKEIENAFFENTKKHILADEKRINKNTKDLLTYYEKAVFETEGRIHALYSRFAKDNNMTVKEAREFITSSEQKVFNKTISEYMRDISLEGENSLTKIELDTLSTKARLTREEKLLADIYMDMGKMADVTNAELEKVLEETLKTSFVRSAFDVQNAMGVYYRVNMLSDPAIKMLVNHTWAKKDYSKALWSHVDNFNANIKQVLTDGFIQGKSIDKMIRSLKEKTGACHEAVERLVKTEVKYFANKGELEGYKANGITKYVYMGSREKGYACNCASLNGVIIDVDKAVPLENFPPLHPHCMCSVRAYFDNSLFDNNENLREYDKEKSLDTWKHDYIIKNEEDLVKGLQEELGCDIIKKTPRDFERIDKTLANKASYSVGVKGGIDLHLYDDKGRVTKTFTNHNHDTPKHHNFGEFGEHIHDWILNKKGEPVRQKQREVTAEEKSIMERIL